MTTPKRRRGGYPLPAVIDPPNDVCYVIHIPDDPAYHWAFWQSYEYLTRWVAWKRDPGHNATLAAQRMKESLVRTWDTLDTIGDICTLDINVTCGSNCCSAVNINIEIINNVHVDQDVVTEVINLPGGNGDDGQTPPNQDWNDYPAYLVEKCAVANQIADDWLHTLENFSDFGLYAATLSLPTLMSIITSLSVSNLIWGSVAISASLAGAIGAILGSLLVIASLGLFAFGYFDEVRQQIDRDAFVCALYNATDANDAVANALTVVGGWVAASLVYQQPLGQQFVDQFNAIARALIVPELLETLFDSTSWSAALAPSDCSLCQGVIPPPPGDFLSTLVLYHALEEASGSRFDSHVNNLDLALGGSVAQGTGIVAFGANYPSTGSPALTKTTDPVMEIGAVDWTWAGWARLTSLSGADGFPFSRTLASKSNNNANDTTFIIGTYKNGGVQRWFARRGWTSGFDDLIATFPVELNLWQFVIVWYDAVVETLNMQVDDATAQFISTAGHNPITLNTPYQLGAWPGLGRNFIGDIDEVGLWVRNLTPSEKTWLYNSGAGRTYADF